MKRLLTEPLIPPWVALLLAALAVANSWVFSAAVLVVAVTCGKRRARHRDTEQER